MSAYSEAVLADNPALYWRLGGAEGTTAQDETANNRDGTYGEGVTLGEASLLKSDAANKAVKLSGTPTGRITSAYNPFASGATRTYEGWARRTNSAGGDTLMGGNSTTAGHQPLLRVEAGSPATVNFYPRAGNAASWANAWPGNDQDVHWVLVHNDATKKATLWINGESKGEKSTTDAYNTEPGFFVAGAWFSPGNNPWHGKMDEVAIYSGALSEARIKAHYEVATTEGPPLGTRSLMGVGR